MAIFNSYVKLPEGTLLPGSGYDGFDSLSDCRGLQFDPRLRPLGAGPSCGRDDATEPRWLRGLPQSTQAWRAIGRDWKEAIIGYSLDHLLNHFGYWLLFNLGSFDQW